MKVNIKEISRLTGYSPATVSNALNHKRGVNKETADKIFQVAREIGYLTETPITKIKLVIFRKNGSIVDDTPFFPLLIRGFEQECRRFGYEMVLCNVDQRDTDYARQVTNLLSDSGSGVVLLATEMMENDINLFKNAECPLVVLDYWDDEIELNSVLINNTDAARKATEHLIANGHTEIGYLRGAYRIKGFRARNIGYQQALKKHSLEYNTDYTYTVAPTMNGAYQEMRQHLKTKGRKKLPTAFFADNDMVALGAIKAFQDEGYQIPEDISIIGFDDLPFSEISSPRLSTMRVPNMGMGQIAVRRVVELINSRDSIITKTEVCPILVSRDTVGKPR